MGKEDVRDVTNKTPNIIPTGALFTVSTGVYSDYTVHGVFRALRDIDTAALLQAWLEAHPRQKKSYAFEDSDFLADAYRHGYFEPVVSREWHLEDYGSSDEMYLNDEGAWGP